MNNIKISKELADQLISESIEHYDFGTPKSKGGHDIDRVYIMPNYDWWVGCVVNSHHWLHYKSNEVDYLFTTQSHFARAIIEGSSHVPMEVLFCNADDEGYHKISFLPYGHVSEFFKTFKMMKCYLGLMRKDIKQYNEYIIKGGNEKAKKKWMFILAGGNMVSGGLLGESAFKAEDFNFEEKSPLIIHDQLRLELNKQAKAGKIPSIYSGWDDVLLDLDQHKWGGYDGDLLYDKVVPLFVNHFVGE